MRENGTAYFLKPSDEFSCSVREESSQTEIGHIVRPQQLVGQQCVQVAFTATTPGKYVVEMKVNQTLVAYGDQTFTPGKPVKLVDTNYQLSCTVKHIL